jgi:hypothetical protein
MHCSGTKLTYLDSFGRFLTDEQYSRHPGRRTTTDHPSASSAPSSNRCVPSRSVLCDIRGELSDLSRWSARWPARWPMRVLPTPDSQSKNLGTENGGPILTCRPIPCQFLESEPSSMNSLTYLKPRAPLHVGVQSRPA